jgi:hypothetical protein
VEATEKLRSGGPLPDGGAPAAAVDSGGSLQHKANKYDVRGNLVWRKGAQRSAHREAAMVAVAG